ncbi:MAG: 2-C-methyl-D-erythritol 4-phosphate cytidylyltransferase [Pseudomonadales bacterium]|nr:2-C-methyl-D-erythritol 4-phosphate cytidylyltransferase [Pseudomonadales bacterium]
MRFWCVVPAGGSGSRFGAAVPKQYLSLAGRPLLCWSLDALAAAGPEAIVLVVAPDDAHATGLPALADCVRIIADGGATRAESVLAGLRALAGQAAPDDWVLVHDAARPCLDPALVARLLEAVAGHADGGLLARPVAETVKEACIGEDSTAQVRRTLDRDGLWLAQTPQAFRHGALLGALEAALAAGVAVTDEASAIEHAGGRPLLVPGARANLKVTRPEDLPLAEFWLARTRTDGVERA